MPLLPTPLKQKLFLLLICTQTFIVNPALAKSDMEMMAEVQKARQVRLNPEADHSEHEKPTDPGKIFRGVFYGYLPCANCAGIKTTLSLKNKYNYLLVTQYAQASNREYYEKGKYEWNEKTQIVTLTPRKNASIHKYLIEDEATLIALTPEGKYIDDTNLTSYTLLRGDKNKSRSVHIH